MSSNNYPHSIPTPPFSPNSQQLPSPDSDNPLKSTIHLLDSLVAFYQHERMWVYRTRAVLEEAFESLPAVTPSSNPDSQQEDNPLPSPSDFSASPAPSESTPAILDADNADNASTPRPGQVPSRWMRRKKGFKLRLEGIAPKAKRPGPSKPSKRDQRDQDAREHILQLFEKMMEDRMESCQRVNKLVRNANRAYLHGR